MTVEVVIIVAMSANRVIGKKQTIPWHIPGELLRFKQTTWGHPLVMGRKTFESIGRPLPGRRNIVVSRNAAYEAEGCEMAADLHAALALCAKAERVFVIGGEQIFAQALPLADTLILTTIAREVDGDTFFPEIGQEFIQLSREEVFEPEPYVVEVFRRMPGRAGREEASFTQET